MKYVGYIASIVVLALLGAFTVSTLWSWFIVPFGLPAIGYAHAYGVMTFINFFLAAINVNTQKKEADINHTIAVGFSINFFALLFGWIAHSFM